MTRTQFLGLFAIPFLPKIDLEQEGHVFNVKKIKERLAFLRKYPLTKTECFFPSGHEIKVGNMWKIT